ncbi:MAG: MOSC domain-containing protein [Anaerolineae bacterium]|nr:MOSC domain-containing protein [Anaerolineae bacterium]
MAKISSLVYQPARSSHKPPYRYNRVPADALMLLAGHGIEGDFKAGRSVRRQLNIMSAAMVAALTAEGFKTAPGELGEQIVIDGLDVATLKKGDVLCLGDEACIEITMIRTPCEWFEKIQNKTMAEAEGRVGMMAKVIQSGRIKVGDEVALKQPEPVV